MPGTACVFGGVRLSLLLLLRLSVWAGADPAGCGSGEVVRVAEETLDQINRDQNHGYILTLNRVYDYTRRADQASSIFSLELDVLETKCHVSSRKHWKQCEVRSLDSVPVYGECRASVAVDSEVRLQSYSCSIRKVPATEVIQVCPDCPTAESLEEPVVQEVAHQSLHRFNEESRLTNRFSLDRITGARFQWVVGPSYFVEFTMVETTCSKTSDPGDVCAPKDCGSARRGFCEGSHMPQEETFQPRLPAGQKTSFKKSVEVKCEIYEPQELPLAVHNRTHSSGSCSSAATQTVLGAVVDQASRPRSAPSAASCPGTRRHHLGLHRLRL